MNDMTKMEAYKTCLCRHCVFLDEKTGMCLCGDPESDECPKCSVVEEQEEENE